MFRRERTIYACDTAFEHYEVVDMVYEGRPARVLFTAGHRAAQSGVATDGKPELLFDYNQRLFELASSLQPQSILVIGGGAYTLPSALAAELPEAYIDVVEIDPGLDEIAVRFFGLMPLKRLRIIHTDGRHYIEKTSQKYDLILIDAFTGTEVPYELITLEAMLAVERRLTSQGIMAMNVIGILHSHGMKLKSLLSAYQHTFKQTHVYPADDSISLLESQNFILLGQKRTGSPPYSMKTSAVSSPAMPIDTTLFDKPPTVTLGGIA